jgi:putative colanic acid biosynthesis UDP-glucose lipid carrier transferase
MADDRESRDYRAPFRIAGSRGSAVSSPDAREDFDSIRPVATLLMGAAHADGELRVEEQETVRDLLRQLLGCQELPGEVEAHLRGFDPAAFDLERAIDEFRAQAHTSERRMLELVRKVCDADATVDLSEDNYMLALALAMSLAPPDYQKLVVRESSGINGPIKRFLDVLLGSIAFACLALPMLLIATAVKLSSPGPVLFRQRRYGRAGAVIDVFKFRTMSVLEDGSDVKQVTARDPRVTPLGNFLRRSSLDELPQLFNVLRGEMSLVGPRPHAVLHNEQYRRQIVEYMLRHKVKPGITGWAQVNGHRGETDTLRKMVHRVEHDLYYIRHWSLWLDAKILFLTIFGRRVWRNAQ